MSRHRSASSYGQRIQRLGLDCYAISWTVDFYYPSSRLRHPRGFSRITDETGAKRFAAKWEIDMPSPPAEPQP